MKIIFFLSIFFSSFFLLSAQSHIGLCEVEVDDVKVLNTFGYLNYSVQFLNSSSKTVDGIYWKADFYDNSGVLVQSEESAFNSGGMIEPVAPGSKKFLARVPKIKGASKVVITILKVHFESAGNCP